MITKEQIKSQRWLGPLTAISLLVVVALGWIFNWFNLGPFMKDPLTAWAAFIASVVMVGCVVYLLAIFSDDAKPMPEEKEDDDDNNESADPAHKLDPPE